MYKLGDVLINNEYKIKLGRSRDKQFKHLWRIRILKILGPCSYYVSDGSLFDDFDLNKLDFHLDVVHLKLKKLKQVI